MTYSRGCGVSVAACGAQECVCVSVDPAPVDSPEIAAQLFGDDFPCCNEGVHALYATAHNEAREDV